MTAVRKESSRFGPISPRHSLAVFIHGPVEDVDSTGGCPVWPASLHSTVVTEGWAVPEMDSLVFGW